MTKKRKENGESSLDYIFILCRARSIVGVASVVFEMANRMSN